VDALEDRERLDGPRVGRRVVDAAEGDERLVEQRPRDHRMVRPSSAVASAISRASNASALVELARLVSTRACMCNSSCDRAWQRRGALAAARRSRRTAPASERDLAVAQQQRHTSRVALASPPPRPIRAQRSASCGGEPALGDARGRHRLQRDRPRVTGPRPLERGEQPSRRR